MQRTLYLTVLLAAGSLDTAASPSRLQSIAATAGQVESDALAIHRKIRAVGTDEPSLRASVQSLGQRIAALQTEVAALDAGLGELTARQRSVWESVRMEAELLSVFHGRKSELADLGVDRNRGQIRQLAVGIAKRARQLRLAASRMV